MNAYCEPGKLDSVLQNLALKERSGDYLFCFVLLSEN